MKILFIGDIVGKPGRRLIRDLLPGVVNHNEVDLVVANGENASGGLGLNIKAAEELFSYGIDILTSGNHIYRYREIYDYMDESTRLIRPANYPDPSPGHGSAIIKTPGGVAVGVINVMGRTYMTPIDCPFQIVDRELEKVEAAGARVILVDFHAEATSEKRAMGWHLDGRAAAMVGTHTHVQTADEEILPGGTAYITDLGMTGPHRSVIGMKREPVLLRFRTGMPSRFETAKKGLKLEGSVVEVDPSTNRSINIHRIQIDG